MIFYCTIFLLLFSPVFCDAVMDEFYLINSFTLCTTASLQCFDRQNNILSQTHYSYCGFSITSLLIDSTLEKYSGIIFFMTLHLPFRGIISGETQPEERLKLKWNHKEKLEE